MESGSKERKKAQGANTLDILLINSAIHSGEAVIRADRCQIKDFAGFGIWPPVSLVQIAAVLREEGYHVHVLDAVALGLPFDEMVSSAVEMAPNLIIIQSITPTLSDDLDAAAVIGGRLPEVEFVFYGLHATVRPQDILGNPVRFAIRGEPERTLLELADAIQRGDKGRLPHIRGLSYIEGGKIRTNPDRELIEDLSELPYPAIDLLPLDRYVIPSSGEPFSIIHVSRGCPFRCIYCTSNPYYRNRWRIRSVSHVIGEIAQAIERFSIRNFMFLSDTFNIKEDYVIELCNSLIESGLDIHWICNSRVDTFTTAMASAMKRAGCWLISFGVESGSDKILKLCKKGATTTQAVEAIRVAREVGIKSLAYFMFGLPGETKETIKETTCFAVNLDPDYAHFYMATPFPGTEFFDMAEKEGWLISHDWSRYFHGFSDVISYPDLPVEEMQEAIKRAYRVFYRRPKVYLRELSSVRSLRELRSKVRTAYRLFRSNISD